MVERDADLPEGRRMLLRIGVNIGEVIVDGEDIFGDGVNVAARLQETAEPAGIAISATVHEHTAGKLDVTFADGGEHQFKNITRPIHVWHWQRKPSNAAVSTSVVSELLPLPDKPSIAVLPFDNMSGDPEQEYFSDGISEDIITALSKVHWLFVIARNSTFTYKGAAVDVMVVARELGVRYVLEGSVRKAANKVRITAQLADGTTGNHVWAERYDRELDDIFALQDEITETLVGLIDTELRASEIDRARHKPPACQRRLKFDPLGRLKADPALDEQATTRGAIRLLKRVVACGGCCYWTSLSLRAGLMMPAFRLSLSR